MANESPKRQKCLRCLTGEHAVLHQRLYHLALTRGQRRLLQQLTGVTERLLTQAVRQTAT